METNTGSPHAADDGDGHVLFGAALMLLGLAFLVDQADWVEWSISMRFWPFILLALGLGRLVAPGMRHGRRRSRRSAVWPLSIGVWALISEYEFFGLDYRTSWPLLVVAAGLNIVLKSLETPVARQMREN